MSEQKASPPQTTAAQNQRPSSPTTEQLLLMDDLDIGEQVKIHSQLTRNLDTAYERAVEEAIRRSLFTGSETQSSQSSSLAATCIDSTTDQPVACTSVQQTSMSRVGDTAGGDLVHRGAAPLPDSRTHVTNVGSSSDQRHASSMAAVGADTDTAVNGLPNIETLRLGDADDAPSHAPRSRRDQYQQQQQTDSERRPSLDRMVGSVSERRPSLDRMNQQRSERRPSLDRAKNYVDDTNQHHSERRPSLDRMNSYRSERRSSIEMRDSYASERRPSLELMENYSSERRPSLERMEGAQQSERRPSLERVSQHERPSSQDCIQSLHSLTSLDPTSGSNGTAQGINTLRPWPLNEMGIPTNWDVMQLPGDGDGMYRLVLLSPMDREYSAITVDFEEAGLKVVSVARLQNSHLLDRFNDEKKRLLRLRPPDFELNERYLYHGTQANKQRLCEEGLDHRLSFQGCFGRGIYFSDNPRKCMNYATSATCSADTHPMILVCRVILGESKIYQQGIKDSNLKREPEKPKAKGGWRYYDSVQGIPVDYPEFVVYDNHRSMIEYIVTFEEVGYRAPPSASNFYPAPSLYKVEPVTLPIPEQELDRMYMLGPDTDSDGSCDEHTREVEALRDNVKRAKAQRLGIPYRPPTKEEKRYERLHWKRVCYYSCPPASPLFEMMIIKKKQEKAARMKRKAEEKAKKAAEEGGASAAEGSGETLGAIGGNRGSPSKSAEEEEEDTGYQAEDESVAEVLDAMIADFLRVTETDNVAKARRYIRDNSMDLDSAVLQYYRDMD